MIRPGIVWGITRAETRLTRRLVRYWIFTVLASLAAVATWGWYAFIHAQFSANSASAAAINPRFLVSSFGSTFLLLFLLALVFLGYDLRARDTRERMSEVLDAMPCSNLELVAGRFLGILIPSFIPAAVIIGILEIVGLATGWPIEPWSMLGLLIFMTIPGFAFTLGLVYLVTMLVRNRLVAALILVGFVVGLFTVSNFMPLYSLPMVDITGGLAFSFPSDLVPEAINSTGLVQRTAFLLGGLGMLLLAAALYPRKDDTSRGMTAIAGAVLVLLWLGTAGYRMMSLKGGIEHRAALRAAHETLRDEPTPDILTLGGEVFVRRGKRVELEIDLTFRAPRDRALEVARFTLNPGIEVTAATSNGAALVANQHDVMLELALSPPLGPGETRQVHLAAAGRPNPRVAYFDAATDVYSLKPPDANILILGIEPLVLQGDYAVLLPGLYWLPSSGVRVGPTGSDEKPRDFFDVDLTVDLPQGWTAAGPGLREPLGEANGRTRLRFAAAAPVPDVALVAGRFESLSTEVGGVRLEALFHPAHAKNFEVFDEAANEIRSWLDERLTEAADAGLPYPYRSMSLVEVPNRLRGFGGGWRMDTTLPQPTMMLLRESSLPTAYFRKRFQDTSRFSRFEGGVAEGMRRTLESFFENDLNGGNPFVGAARNFFTYQTDGVGAEGLPLDFVAENLVTKLLADKQSYFSVHFFDRNFGQRFGQAAQQMNNPDRFDDSYADVLVHLIISRAEVWDAIMNTSLADLDPWEDPARTIDVLALKGGAMAESMYDGLGRDKAGELLAALRSRGSGGSFTREDVLAAGSEVGVDLAPWLDVWIEETRLPGFRIGDVQVQRLEDGEDGTPRYQTRVTVYNGEDVPGMLMLQYAAGEGDDRETDSSDPVRVEGTSAVEVGIVTSKPLSRMRLKPYLSLNRDAFNIPLPELDAERIVKQEPFTGIQSVAWAPEDTDAVIVDDLDQGFHTDEKAKRSLRVEGRGDTEVETDQGIPAFRAGRLPSEWSRAGRSTAYGAYRRTVAMVRAGSGEKLAVFEAELPRAGHWRLEYHLPSPGNSRREAERGTWTMQLVDDSGSQDITFDAQTADNGWNILGDYEVAAGTVRVEVSDKAEGGKLVIADAVRWTPVAGDARASADR